MKVAIAGAGKVGTSMANELSAAGHAVLIIDRSAAELDGFDATVTTYAGDACEIAVLEASGLSGYDVMIAATGDDKANLVVSLLAKTEYGIPRVVARVNHPRNEWMFNESWGVDVSVSTPRILSALVEEAVTVGDVVRLFTLRQSESNLVEFTLPDDSPVIARQVGSLSWPSDAVLVVIARDGRVIQPTPQDTLEAHDELLFVAAPEAEPHLKELLRSRGSAVSPER
jgi:trk system potassium uptake protein TrkA